MKKIFAIAPVLVLALSLLTACGGGGNNSSGNSVNKNGGGEKFEYGQDYIAQNLKGDYSITYKYSISGQDDLIMTHTKTSAGYYYNYMGMEGLFVKNGDKYDTYQGSAETGFTKVDFMDPLTEEEVKNDSMYSLVYGMIDGFMIQYGNDTSGMKKDGTATVAGRNCEKYTFQIAGMGAAYKYSYYIDKATGVCLKWDYDVAAGGQAASMTFECTEFKTSGVTLPSYS